MNWLTGPAAFVVIWWIVIFAVLPIGVKPAEDEMGGRAGAPSNPQIGKKAIVTTVIASILWVILYVVVSSNVWSFRS